MGAKRLNPEYITFDKSRVASVIANRNNNSDAFLLQFTSTNGNTMSVWFEATRIHIVSSINGVSRDVFIS